MSVKNQKNNNNDPDIQQNPRKPSPNRAGDISGSKHASKFMDCQLHQLTVIYIQV